MSNTLFISSNSKIDINKLSFSYIFHKTYGYPKSINDKKSFSISWIYIASYTNSIGKTYWAQKAFVSTIKINEFIPFENLTKNDIQNWIYNLPNIFELKNILLEIIKNQIEEKEQNLIAQEVF